MNKIITITCNPAIDRSIYEDREVFDIGGKGINVSKTLKVLGLDSICIGFVGKDNKDLLFNQLDDLNLKYHFIEVEGKIRTNTKRIINNELYEENENGPFITKDKTKELLDYISLFHDDIFVISGSISKNVEDDYYQRMIKLLKDNNNFVLLDCSGIQLKNGIKEKPNIIKPNIKEICELFDIEYDEELIIKKIKELDIDLTVLSKGKDGALFIKDDVYICEGMDVEYRSALAAGDSMVAALAYSKYKGLSLLETIKYVMATSFACVETEGSKAPLLERINYYLDKVVIKKYRY